MWWSQPTARAIPVLYYRFWWNSNSFEAPGYRVRWNITLAFILVLLVTCSKCPSQPPTPSWLKAACIILSFLWSIVDARNLRRNSERRIRMPVSLYWDLRTYCERISIYCWWGYCRPRYFPVVVLHIHQINILQRFMLFSPCFWMKRTLEL